MSLTLERVSEPDIPRLIEIMYAAFAGDPWNRIMFPQIPPPEARTPSIEQCRKELTNPQIVLMKVVDQEANLIIAFARWSIYKFERSESEWKTPADSTWDKGTNVEAANAFMEANYRMRRKYMGGKPHCCLNLLVCDPDHQRRGAGRMLLCFGTNIADEVGNLPCYLEGSLAGRPLYSSVGFEVVDTISMDMSGFGGKGIDEHWVMIRPAKLAR